MSPRRREPDPWPWPGDSTLDRARRVAWSYRDALSVVNPEACARLDARMVELGQTWAKPRPQQYDENDMLTAVQVAEMCDVKVGTVDRWRERGMPGVRTPDGLRFRVRDVLDFNAERRRRRART